MSQWSKHPPCTEGVYHFRGVRLTRNNQTVRHNEPVRVQHMQVGQRTSLGVAMLGKQRVYPLNSFKGMWAEVPLVLHEMGVSTNESNEV